MKVKLLGCSLSILLSVNCYALEIYKGHLVNHKEWTTGGAKMLVKEGKNQRLKMLTPTKNSSGVFSNSFNSIDFTQGVVNVPIDIKSTHQIYVLNDTEQTHQYSYILGSCAQIDTHNIQCGYYLDSVELKPGGYVYTDEQPLLQVVVKIAGNYMVNSFTSLGVEGDYNGNYSNASSSSLLFVADSKR